MARPPSTLRSLIPLTCTAVVQDTPYTEALPEDSPYLPFAENLDDFDRHPQKYPTWGVYTAQEMLHDNGAAVMPRTQPDRGAKYKIKPSVMEGFASYFTAIALYDTIVRVTASEPPKSEVLRHPRIPGWIGDNKRKYFVALQDLPQVVRDFMANCQSPGFTGESSSVDAGARNDHTTRLADEIVASGEAIGAFAAVRNVAVVAFNIAIMAKGFLHVPVNYQELDVNLSSSRGANVIRVMGNAKRLRQVLMIAATISPLALLQGVDLLNANICPEEAILNFKRLGNEKPAGLRRLEDELWTAIFSVAEGHQSATGALKFICQVWRARNAHTSLSAADIAFFEQDGESIPYHPSMSLYAARPSRPFPIDWPLPPACAQDSNEVAADSPPLVEQSPPSTDRVSQDGAEEEPVIRRSDRQAKQAVAPNAYANAQEPKKPKPKKSRNKTDAPHNDGKGLPAKRLRRKDKSTVILDSDIDDTSSEEDDIELLDYDHLQRTERSLRNHLGEELVVKLEDSPILMEHARKSVLDALDFDETPAVFSDPSGRTFKFWDADGKAYPVKPVFHSQKDSDAWGAMFDRAEKFHLPKEGSDEPLPAFLARPDESLFRCMTFTERQNMSVAQLQDIMRRQSPVTTGVPGPFVKFAPSGLETVSDLHTNAEFHDQSIPVNTDFSVRMKSATLYQVYKHTLGPRRKRKPLNGLNFPNHHSGVQPSPFATDERAVRRTQHDRACLSFIVGHYIVFSLVATEYAMSYIHEDAHGEATRVRVATGLKLWGLVEPLDPRDISSTEFWTNPKLNIRDLDLSKWRVEFIMLRAGDELNMIPSTKHAVLTVADCIVHGNYFLSTTCLGRTACGMVHTFFEARIATNASHPAFHGRLNAICAYIYRCVVLRDRNEELDDGYMPDFASSEGLKNFILFACAIELQLALTRQSYQPTEDDRLIDALGVEGISLSEALQRFDLSAAPYDLRAQIVYSRGRMKHLLRYVLSRISITDENGDAQDPWDFLFTPTLAWFMYGMKDYYRRSSLVPSDSSVDEDNQLGESTVDPADVALPPEKLFLRQLSFCAGRWPSVDQALHDLEASECPVAHFVVDWPKFTVEWEENEGAHTAEEESKSHADIFQMGCTDGDLLFFNAHACYTSGSKRKREATPADHSAHVPWLTTRELSRAPSVYKKSRSV